MDRVKHLYRPADLVPLQMADHVPDDLGTDLGTVPFGDCPQRGLLLRRFLHPVLADLRDPAGDRFPDLFNGNSLGHGDQPDAGRVPANRLGRLLNPLPDPFQILFDHKEVITAWRVRTVNEGGILILLMTELYNGAPDK